MEKGNIKIMFGFIVLNTQIMLIMGKLKQTKFYT